MPTDVAAVGPKAPICQTDRKPRGGKPPRSYLRWERDLKPLGFHLAARVLEFPGGFPGDIGLYLAWGE